MGNVNLNVTEPLAIRSTHLAPIADLKPAGLLRLAGQDAEHVRALARSEEKLPPIVVHRATGTVIDGGHRLAAAAANGKNEIEIVFFDGTEEEAFLYAVRANLEHGLRLTLEDRKAAARRILSAHPDWSDRLVARTVGLSPKTVAGVRDSAGRSAEEGPHLDIRRGLDGSSRAADPGRRRQLVIDLATRQPDMSLREIARVAGVSPSTVLNVRRRLAAGQPQPAPAGATGGQAGRARRTRSSATVIEELARDPALRYNESGKSLLRWLTTHAIDLTECERHAGAVPPHRAKAVVELAEYYARVWGEFAVAMARKAHGRRPSADIPGDEAEHKQKAEQG
ncbi:MAG TPA: ParB N-terminal domain-containing protein [Actinocrinis sp.]|nr:ParB N-terminal domain-containing protein [Actinocrinis sp.]